MRTSHVRLLASSAGLCRSAPEIREHLAYERLSAEQESHYYGLDIRPNMVDTLRKSYPRVKAVVGENAPGFKLPYLNSIDTGMMRR